MREMKDSGVDYIGQIPCDWRLTKIKFCADIFGRIGFRGYTEQDLVDYEEDGAITLSPSNFHDMKMDYQKCTYLSWKKYEESPEIMIDNGDVLLVKTGSTYGKAVYVTNLPKEATINPQLIVFKNIGLDNKLFSYILQTKMIKIQTELAVVGGTIPTMSQEKIYNFIIPEIPEKEQHELLICIDQECEELGALVSDIQSQIKTLEEYKRSVITEVVTKGLDPDVEMRDSGIAWVGDIPAHWLVEKVKFHLQRNEPRNPGDKQVLSVYREYGVIPKDSRDDNHNVTSEDTSNYKYVVPGNLVINKMKAWQGSMGVSEYEGIVSPAYFIYKFTDNQIMPKYLHYLFRSCYKDEFRRISGGIREGQWDLSPYEFSNTLLLIPPTDEQNRIVSYIDARISEIESAITEKKQQIETIEEYKKSLIFEYVTGKKEVQA